MTLLPGFRRNGALAIRTSSFLHPDAITGYPVDMYNLDLYLRSIQAPSLQWVFLKCNLLTAYKRAIDAQVKHLN